MSELSIYSINEQLPTLSKEYSGMLENIKENLPVVQRVADNFYKPDSQFKNATLDITDLTPISTIKHILAVIEKTKAALSEAQIKRAKSQIELEKKQRELSNTEDDLDKRLLEIEIVEIVSGLQQSENYVKAAIRKLSSLITQYHSVMKHIGKDHLTEEDYEREERRYHIMTAFKQALNSARPRGGVMDEGNSIYMFELGINVAHAQVEIFNYINAENEVLKQNKAPSHMMTVKWLEACADLFEDCPQEFAESRGLKVLDKKSLTITEPYKLPENKNT